MTDQRRGFARRRYLPEDKARAVGLALTVGAREAGRQTGIPFGLIARWAKSPDLAPVVIETRERVADRLWQTIQVGTEAVLEGLRDPKARLSDKAQALRVAIEAHALMTGQATSRTENRSIIADVTADLSDVDKANLRRALDDAIAAQTLDAVRADPLADLDRDAILALVALIESKIGEQSS